MAVAAGGAGYSYASHAGVSRVAVLRRNCRRVGNAHGCIPRIAGAPGIFAAIVQVNVQLGIGMEFEDTQAVSGADQSLCAAGAEGEVRKLGGAEPADAVSGNALHAEIDLFTKQLEMSAGTATPAGARVVESAGAVRRGNCCRPGSLALASHLASRRVHNIGAGIGADYRAGEDAVAEGAEEAEDLVVAKARIRGGFENEIRGFVHRVAGCVERVIETTARSRSVDEEVLRSGNGSVRGSILVRSESAAANGGLRTLDG